MKTQKELIALLSEQVQEINMATVKPEYRKVEAAMAAFGTVIRAQKDQELTKYLVKFIDAFNALSDEIERKNLFN